MDNNATFFRHAVLVEGGMGLIALIIGCFFGLPWTDSIDFNDPQAWLYGIAGTLPMVLCYFILKNVPLQCLKTVDQLVRDLFRRYMNRLSLSQLLLIAALAGLGEELLFRGLMQIGLSEFLRYQGFGSDGLATALAIILLISLLFGLAHAATWTYFVLALLISVYLGFVFWWTGNLLVPILIHALYDFGVFLALRFELQKETMQ